MYSHAQRFSLRRLLPFAIGVFALVALVPVAYAQDEPSVSIISPTDGETVTGTDITLEVEHSGFNDAAHLVGTPDQEGEGHLHVMVGGMSMANLIGAFADTNTITIPGTGLEPGEQTIIVAVASNSHMVMMDTAQEVTIDYQPDEPAPAPEPEEYDDPPVVEITNLEDGVTLGPDITLELNSENFNVSPELDGKPNIRGWGHYHVFLNLPMEDGMPDMEAMSMEGMLGMPGQDTASFDLSAWPEGEHTLVVMPANNDHTPVMPSQMAMLSFTLDHSDDEEVEAEVDDAAEGEEEAVPEMPATGGGGTSTTGDSGSALLYGLLAGATALIATFGILARWGRFKTS